MLARFIDKALRLIGCNTFKRQIRLSTLLMLVVSVIAAFALYLELSVHPAQIDIAGRQRMLSQKMAKETLLVSQQVMDRQTLNKTIQLFDTSHQNLLKGERSLKLKALKDPAILAQMETVDQLWRDYRRQIDSYLSSPSGSNLQNLNTLSVTLLKEMNKAVGMMTLKSAEHKQQTLVTAFVAILFILLLVQVGNSCQQRLMSGVLRLRECMLEAGKGHLATRLPVIHPDNEVGSMFQSFNDMSDHICSLVDHVRDVAVRADEHVRNVYTATQDAQQGINRQYSDIEQVATAMNEMSSTVHDVANNTTEAADSAQHADEQAQHSGEVVDGAVIQIQQMETTLNETAASLRQLADETANIEQVLEVITGVAEQTNLLALNAAIEAARAGDQGRGFAVVADEVRTLAQRTQSSTQEIRTIIDRLQGQAQQAVGSMERTSEQASVSVESVHNAQQALKQIVTAVDTINNMNALIATAAEEQSQVATEIDERVTNISQVAGQTQEDSEQIVRAIGSIREEVDTLVASMEEFQTRR